MIEKKIQTVAMSEIWKKTSDGYLQILMDIYNPDIKWNDNSLEQDNMHLRVVSDSNNVKYKGDTYLACKFNFKAPDQDGAKTSTASINISSIDSRVVQLLRSVNLVSEVSIIAAFAKNESVYKFYPLERYVLNMKGSSYGSTSATLNLQPDDVWTMNVPRDSATKDKLPSVNTNA